MPIRTRSFSSITAVSAVVLGGCASFPHLKSYVHQAPAPPAATSTSELLSHPNDVDKLNPPAVFPIPASAGEAPRRTEPAATDADIAQLVSDNSTVEVSLPPQSLPSLIDTVFGDVLKVPYALGPGVADRHDMVALRTPPSVSRRALFKLTQTALKEEFDLNVYIRGGQVLVAQSAESAPNSVSVVRNRSAANEPANTQIVVEFFQLNSIDVNSLQDLLKDLYGGNLGIKIKADVPTNTMVIAGPARTVQAAAALLGQLDQPTFSGAQVARFEPIFWSSDNFSHALGEALQAEGYLVSTTPQVSRGVMLLSLPTTNEVLAFATSPALMSRVQFWAKELDQPNRVGDQKTTFVYEVKNTDATSLGDLLMGQRPQSTTTPPVGVPGAPPTSSSANVAGSSAAAGQATSGALAGGLAGGATGQITVDPVGNRILYTGTAADFSRLKSVLDQLDQPPKQVLIEVTVAEVTLTDQTNVGLEWFFSHSQGNQSFSGGTKGGLSLATNGFTLTYTGPNLTANFEAFASNNKVNILSRPRIVAKSGTDAQIQVGTDVPIITSQAASTVQTGGATNVLQSVEYRQTGIILHVKPVVFGKNRVDLTISQEVSSQQANSNAAIASPLILDRSVQTELSLTEGATAVLGGLMDDEYTKGNNGVPIIKDIPIIGEVARTDTINGSKTELVLLVTPFIINDPDDMQGVANSLSDEINRAFKVGRGWSYTLLPFSPGVNVGLGIPAARTKALDPPPPAT